MCFLRKYEVFIIKILKELIRFYIIYLILIFLKIRIDCKKVVYVVKGKDFFIGKSEYIV